MTHHYDYYLLHFTKSDTKVLFYLGENIPHTIQAIPICDQEYKIDSFTGVDAILHLCQASQQLPYGLLVSLNYLKKHPKALVELFERIPALERLPIIGLYPSETSQSMNHEMEASGLDEVVCLERPISNILSALELQKQRKLFLNRTDQLTLAPLKTPNWKRFVDLLITIPTLIIFLPVFLLIALIIKLESPGPILYVSSRIGKGYRKFPFYKFRSMVDGADQKLKDLKHLNQYQNKGNTFYKICNDPRVTRFGKFIRKTSLDELPQLFNVLLGHMSIVGNRPLPVYEAEKLLKSESMERFNAPAGLTGLWQVSKRGKQDMSSAERIDLDIQYARRVTFWHDLVIISKTLPAIIQHEQV